jgi:DAK2 domain fusion protein YloV
VPEVLDAAAVRGWCAAGLAALTAAREEIDAINVYPVADRDTGTNLVLTMRSVVDALGLESGIDGPGDAEPLADTVRAMARGALAGARGNSGVILSQLLRGIADVLADAAPGRGHVLARALQRATDLGYAAVDEPVEGTILTVARAAADAGARAAASCDDLAAVAQAAAAAGAAALARTRGQLAVLAAANVVDAGGRGLVVLLDALYAVVVGRLTDAPAESADREPADQPLAGPVCQPDGAGYAYEVQYLLDAGEPDVRLLTARLRELGDSLAVAGAEGKWNVHVHVDDVGAAVEAGIEAGRPHRIAVTRFADRAVPVPAVPAVPVVPASSAPHPGVPTGQGTGRSVVVIADQDGLSELFAAEDAVVLTGRAAEAPPIAEVVDAVCGTGGREVIVLVTTPDAAGVAAAAAVQARLRGRTVDVVPTRSAVQGLAALAVADRDRRFDDDVIAMTAAAGATRWAEVMRAPGRAQTSAGVCEAGDVLGLIEDDVAVIGADVERVAAELLGRLLTGGGELVTVLTGAHADDGLGERLEAWVHACWPAVETVVYRVGQLHRPVLLGVE